MGMFGIGGRLQSAGVVEDEEARVRERLAILRRMDLGVHALARLEAKRELVGARVEAVMVFLEDRRAVLRDREAALAHGGQLAFRQREGLDSGGPGVPVFALIRDLAEGVELIAAVEPAELQFADVVERAAGTG